MISREGITKDLEALAAQGVGVVMIMQMPDWFVNRQPRPSAGRFTFTTWRYYDQAAPLQPSGLLGPVKLLTTRPAEKN